MAVRCSAAESETCCCKKGSHDGSLSVWRNGFTALEAVGSCCPEEERRLCHQFARAVRRAALVRIGGRRRRRIGLETDGEVGFMSGFVLGTVLGFAFGVKSGFVPGVTFGFGAASGAVSGGILLLGLAVVLLGLVEVLGVVVLWGLFFGELGSEGPLCSYSQLVRCSCPRRSAQAPSNRIAGACLL